MITDDAGPLVSSSAADFSSDGTKIMVMRLTDGQWDLYVENQDGIDRVQHHQHAGDQRTVPDVGPDRLRIALNTYDGTDEEIDICILNDVSANRPPEISVGTDALALEGNATGHFAGALSGVSASDPDGDTGTLANDAPALPPLGDMIVQRTASDGEAEVTANQTVTVVDTTVKFSLGGDNGLDIFATRCPMSQQIDGDTLDVGGGEKVRDDWSYLTYKAVSDKVTCAWKTDTTRAGACRQLILRFKDAADLVTHFSVQ